MIMPEETGKRPRTRAPVSCLNCKRRKVRCDKGRPCGGCVKNNVSHLCVYVDPKWAASSKAAATAASGNAVLTPNDNLAELNLIRAELQRKIDKQAGEIQCLRAQLAQKAKNDQKSASDVIPKSKHSESNSGTDMATQAAQIHEVKDLSGLGVLMREMASHKKTPVTVLAKLSGRSQKAPSHVILHDNFYTMSGFRSLKSDPDHDSEVPISPPITGLYAWLNVIKIDPQLTSLWFKITNLQKSYHIYKTNLLRSGPQVPAMVRSHSMQSSDSNGCGHHKCPVVACEFNLMLEETEGGDSEGSASAVKAENDNLSPVKRKVSIDYGSKDALGMLGSLQSLWGEILYSARNTETLSYSQLRFLVGFYMEAPFKESKSGADSRHLLRFFESDILSLFSANGNEAKLEVGSFSSKMSDTEVLNLLKVKAIYMSMLALIVNEAIESLHSDKADMTAQALNEVRGTFPLEFAHAGIATKSSHEYSQILVSVVALVDSIFDPKGPLEDLDSSVSALTLLVTLLDQIGLLYEREHLSIDVRDNFTKVFVLLFDTLTKQGQPLQIWNDPAHVKFQTAETESDDKEKIGVLLCRLWNDVLRLVNNVTFHILPLLRHSSHVDRVLDTFLTKVPEIESSHAHLSYLGQITLSQPQNTGIRDLETSLWAQHVMSRATVLLRNGIHGTPYEKRVLVSEFAEVVAEMAQWGTRSQNGHLRDTRHFEITAVFEYLQFFFASIVFLQFEETGDSDIVAKLTPLLCGQFLHMNKILQKSILEFTKDRHCRYVWTVVAEILARVSHLISGLLIRFKPEVRSWPTPAQKPHMPETLVYASSNSSTPAAGVFIPVSTKEEVIGEADRTVEMLEAHMSRGSSRTRTKIWKFYQTFIRNSHRANPASYARLHAEALGAGRLLDRCPIMTSNSGYETSATRNEVASCPVFHIKPEARTLTPGTCPVSGISGAPPPLVAPNGVKSESAISHMGPAAAGRCPFGHDSEASAADTMRKRKWGHVQDADDPSSPFLGRMAKYTPPLCAPLQSPFPAAVTPSAELQPPPNPDTPFSQAPFGDMDWDSLPNFNFEMMEDEAMMVQLNGGDFNNTMIEGLFQ